MEIQLPKGTRDFEPEKKIIRNKVVDTLKEVFELYGFAPLETPMFERLDVLSSKYAGGDEILKETFKFQDQGKRELALRYDLTVPLARYIAINPNLKMPFKRYQIGEVFRDGPVGPSRYRQFTQCDVDVVGTSSLLTDAEIIDLVRKCFSKLDLEITIRVNNRKLLNEVLDYCGVDQEKQERVILSLDKMEKFGESLVKNELKEQNMDASRISKIMNIMNLKGSNDEKITQLKNLLKESDGLDEIQSLLDAAKKMFLEVEFDISLARGLSYYTGTIIEAFVKNSKVKSSVCAGGRYDKMIGSFINKNDYPAVGISFGIDRIQNALAEDDKRKTNTKVYVIPIKTIDESLKIVKQFRDAEIRADIDLLDKGPSKNLEYANSLGIPYVVFVGKKELQDNKLKLKDMKSGDEEFLELGQIIEKLTV